MNAMNKDLQQEIKSLENKILREEKKINSQEIIGTKSIQKSIASIHSDLKYLSIIANGAPIDPKQNMRIREFLRVHFENLWRIQVPA